MPFIPHTPESLLPRSDSRNPADTCRGLTATGRPCRRPISGSPQSSNSRLSATSTSEPHSTDAFCWQHKEQAISHLPVRGLQSSTVRERTSVDTLIDRLGLLEVSEGPRKRKKSSTFIPQHTQGRQQRIPPPQRRKPKPSSNLGFFCCIGVADNEGVAPRPVRVGGKTAPNRSSHQPMQEVNSGAARLGTSMSVPTPAFNRRSRNPRQSNAVAQNRPSITRDPPSQTADFLSLIPRTTSPQTTSLLLIELAKPVSQSDEEGYIYMFWLTPSTLPSTPPAEAASSLLETPPDRSRPQTGRRRPSDVLQALSSPNKTIMLKIGRASNVQRRLNEWSRQCGYNLSLIRYYPYHSTSTPPSTSSPDVPATPRKVPHAHKVERLIHLELAGKRARGSGKCGTCGKEHREWFEVDGSREGVQAVDEVVRRWVDWGMTAAR